MAYFEYGYVNTDYDINSAEAPIATEQEAIVNVVYNIADAVFQKIVNLHYSVDTGVLFSICDFGYNVFAELAEHIVEFPNNFNTDFPSNKIDFNYNVNLGIFEEAELAIHYYVGDKEYPDSVRITRLNEND